jgi:hypothetical protein
MMGSGIEGGRLESGSEVPYLAALLLCRLRRSRWVHALTTSLFGALARTFLDFSSGMVSAFVSPLSSACVGRTARKMVDAAGHDLIDPPAHTTRCHAMIVMSHDMCAECVVEGTHMWRKSSQSQWSINMCHTHRMFSAVLRLCIKIDLHSSNYGY